MDDATIPVLIITANSVFLHTGNRLDKGHPSSSALPRSCATEYTDSIECQAFSSVVIMGSPRPLTHKQMLPPPLWFQGGRHTRLRERGWGEPIRTKGRTICYISQCCGSGSGIRCLFDPWIRDPGSRMGKKSASGSGIRDPGWTTRIIFSRA